MIATRYNQVMTTNNIEVLVNQTISDFFEQSIKDASAVDSHYVTLWKNLYKLHKSGGKRIRPKIVVMSYQAFGGTDIKSILPIACAQELLHFSMLIHDDIIDRDTTRYGVDNINGAYEKIYSSLVTSTSDRTHYADSAALMAGDLMIAAAHKLINNSSLPDIKKNRALSIMYDGIFEVAGGQLLDTEYPLYPIGTISALDVARYKTASYSFVVPFLSGAMLADANDNQQAVLKDLATNLGIAYQLTDDILGVFGDEAKTGKSSSGDIREGKRTHMIELTTKHLSAPDRVIFDSHFGKPNATDQSINVVKQLIVKSGARAEIEKKIDQYVNKALKNLTSLSLPTNAHAQIINLIYDATKRDV